MASGAVKVKCAIAFDSGNECIAEYVRTALPSEWRPHVTVSTYSQGTDVIEMVRNVLPDMLAIITNLLLLSPDVIEGCVAISPTLDTYFSLDGHRNVSTSCSSLANPCPSQC